MSIRFQNDEILPLIQHERKQHLLLNLRQQHKPSRDASTKITDHNQQPVITDFQMVFNKITQAKQKQYTAKRIGQMLKTSKYATVQAQPLPSVSHSTTDMQTLLKRVNETNKYTISSIHRRKSTQPSFNFGYFDHIDYIMPNKLLLKKQLGIDEENMFRHSLGLEKVMMNRIISQRMYTQHQ